MELRWQNFKIVAREQTHASTLLSLSIRNVMEKDRL
jgi:hypothetical protein